MIEILNSIDTQIFLFFNGIHSSFFDNFMYIFSGKWIWVPFYASIIYFIIRHWKKESIWLIISLVLCIVIADQVSSGIIKGWVERPRPSHAEELNGLVHIVNGYRGGRFGFVSSHAANAFGFVLLCSLLFRQKIYTWILFLWAVITAYSRIYLGVHYPFDIVGGIIVGILAALLCYWLLKKFRPNAINKQVSKQSVTTHNIVIQQIDNYLPLWVLAITVLAIGIYSIIIL